MRWYNGIVTLEYKKAILREPHVVENRRDRDTGVHENDAGSRFVSKEFVKGNVNGKVTHNVA